MTTENNEPHYADDHVILYAGDCQTVMADLGEGWADAIVTDPPYELGFMGKKWDGTGVAFDVETWKRCYALLKPGGHLLAFGGSRTWHRLAVAIEDAGFELRDSIAWLYGSGFPKSMDVSKAIDKVRDWTLIERLSAEIKRARSVAAMSLGDVGEAMQNVTEGQYGHWYHRGGHMFFETGRSLPSRPEWQHLLKVLPVDKAFIGVYEAAEREILGTRPAAVGFDTKHEGGGGWSAGKVTDTAPATDAAKQWQGWGTALKPAFEPIVVARKPLTGTVAANVLEHGTGALNIDACRVDAAEGRPARIQVKGTGSQSTFGQAKGKSGLSTGTTTKGRWPTNVVLDDHAAAELDQQSGVLKSGAHRSSDKRSTQGGNGLTHGQMSGVNGPENEANEGGASRFFPVFKYQAKAPAKERPKVDGVAHPTVKPLELMRWLIRLVTPPDGIVVDPFAGSGTTLEAAMLEGVRSVGIEMDPAHLPLIMHRIERAALPSQP